MPGLDPITVYDNLTVTLGHNEVTDPVTVQVSAEMLSSWVFGSTTRDFDTWYGTYSLTSRSGPNTNAPEIQYSTDVTDWTHFVTLRTDPLSGYTSSTAYHFRPTISFRLANLQDPGDLFTPRTITGLTLVLMLGTAYVSGISSGFVIAGAAGFGGFGSGPGTVVVVATRGRSFAQIVGD